MEQEKAREMQEKMPLISMNTLSDALNKVQGIFQNLPSPDYLDGFQKWLKNRTEEWEKTALRVGIVGITSAGKSTFVNALAGEDILPRGAQPTSGVLVVCRRSSQRKLSVMFRDKSKYEFVAAECTPLWVARYGDESENPNNEQNVMELRLDLPKLAIPEQYEVIDSPGLDAFGLEGHEELTLRTLVPLVDLVLFLTTTKSTSDRENIRALASICKEAKPVIVVQTHKDAVEPRFAKGGKILESKEQVLEKHLQRVKQLLLQTPVFENAYIIQVSSIQALHARQESPDTPVEQLPAWEKSGLGEVVNVLNNLHTKLSQNIATRRIHLLAKELQQVIDRVKSDYYTARGKVEEAQHYQDSALKRLQETQDSLPSEQSAEFPDAETFQKEIAQVKDWFQQMMDSADDNRLENLHVEVRDRIKALESAFFQKVDGVESKLIKAAESLSIDLGAIKLNEVTAAPNLPQLKRYDKLMSLEVIEEKGFVGMAKRVLGKFLKKEEWGVKEKEVRQICIDRESLRQDLQDYHATYRLRLATYLKTWRTFWVNGLSAVFTAIEQQREDIKKPRVVSDPEPYRKLLAVVRDVREWFDQLLAEGAKSHYTMGFQVMKKEKTRKFTMTTRTQGILDLSLPLLQVSRTLNFCRKTHRFWHVTKRLSLHPDNPCPTVLISTPFSQEISDYLSIIGDLTIVDENELTQHLVIYANRPVSLEGCEVPIKAMTVLAGENREAWFLARNSIMVFHDNLFDHPQGVQLFNSLADQSDVLLRVVDLHQVGHERKRLDHLPVKDKLMQSKAHLAYIVMGLDRLLKSDQFVDAYKSYLSLEKAPGFGLLPILGGDGEDLLNSLLWLGCDLREQTVSDEIRAMDILHRTQDKIIEGREKFIKNVFHDIKEFRRMQNFEPTVDFKS
jgi:putative protein kinase ArgK-like GTPase of G3E family